MKRIALFIAPHADDAAVFCGGTIAKFTSGDWNVVLVRVTDDATDSVGKSLEETRRANAEELRTAASHLGIDEIVELGYPTDSLGDVSEVALRERFIYLFRKYRPYAVFSFDPFGVNENNLDHVVTAQAVSEAYWTAAFDLHHPEHFDEGLRPFAVCEQWYYGRELPGANHVEDVTAHLDAKVAAMAAHDTMSRNILHQYRLQLETWGRRVPMLDAALDGPLEPIIEFWFRRSGEAVAAKHALPEGRMAEEYRLERFGGFEAFFQTESEPIPGAPPPPRRDSLDRWW